MVLTILGLQFVGINMSSKKVKKNQKASNLDKSNPIQRSFYQKISTPSNIKYLLAIIVLGTFFVLSPSLQNNFTNWDDNFYVLNNPLISSLSLGNIGAIFTQPVAGNYHPLTILSLAFNHSFSGTESTSAYILTNLALHLLNTCLTFYFVYLLSDKKVIVAAVVSLFFGIHPMHVESVVWISARKDVLYTFFFLLAMLSYWRYLGANLMTTKRKWYALLLLTFLCALLSKPTTIVFPLVMALLYFYKVGWWNKQFVISVLPFVIVSVGFAALTFIAQKDSGAIGWEYPLWQSPFFASYAFVFYIIKFIFPFNLSAFYSFPNPNLPLPVLYYLAPIGVIIVAALVVYSYRFTKIIAFGVLFFLFNIVLTLQFVPIGNAIVAERYTYIPYIGLWFIVASGLYELWTKKDVEIKHRLTKRLSTVVLIGAILAYSYGSFKRSQVWSDSLTLWTDTIEKFPNTAYIAYTNRSHAYRQQKLWSKALVDLNKAIELSPMYPDLYYKRGLTNHQLQQVDAAIADYTKAIELNHFVGHSSANLCQIHFQQGKYEVALKECNQALAEKENFQGKWTTYLLRGRLHFLLQNPNKALQDFNTFITQNKTNLQAYNWRGVAYYELGDTEKALIDFNHVLQIDQTNKEALEYQKRIMDISSK